MAGAALKVSVEVEAGRIQDAFNRLLATDRGLVRAALKNIGEYLVEATQGNFDAERAPSGAPWAPLKPKTLRRKRTQKILTESRRLRDSIVWQLEGAGELAVGTNVIYAATHQFGRGEIPARPFLGLSAADRDEIVEILRAHVARAWEGGKS